MAADDILKNLNLFVDGRGKAGNVDEVSLPDLSLITEGYRGGGMDGSVAVEMGQEAMELSFVLSKYDADVLVLWGIGEGARVPITIRGALESYDGTVTAVRIQSRGKITNLARGTWAPGTKPSLTVTMHLDRYVEWRGERELHRIDLESMVRVIDGVDRLRAQREALGI